MNLFEELNEYLNSDIPEILAKKNGISKSEADKINTAFFYSFISDLIRRSNSSMSTSLLYNQIKSQNAKLKKLGYSSNSKLDEETINKVSKVGEKIISQIFPSLKSSMIKFVSAYAQTPKNINVPVGNFTAAYLVNKMGDKIEDSLLDVGDWALYIRNHHPILFQDSSPEVVKMMVPILGLQELRKQNFSDKKSDLDREFSNTTLEPDYKVDNNYIEDDFEPEEESSSNGNKIAIFIGVLAILGAIGYFLFNNSDVFFGGESKAISENPVVEEVVPIQDSVQINKKVGSNFFNDITTYVNSDRPAGESFKNTSFSFAENEVEMPDSSRQFIKEMIVLMDKYPELQVKFEGDDVNGNSKLGLKRAFAMKRELMNAGIDNIRIDAGAGGKGDNYLNVVVVHK